MIFRFGKEHQEINSSQHIDDQFLIGNNFPEINLAKSEFDLLDIIV